MDGLLGNLIPRYIALRENLETAMRQAFSPDCLDDVEVGLLVYTTLGETMEVNASDNQIKPILQNWIDAVNMATKIRVPPIPDSAHCSRCGYKKACREATENEMLKMHASPIPLLLERVDRDIATQDAITKKQLKLITRAVRGKNRKEYVQTRLVEEPMVLRLVEEPPSQLQYDYLLHGHQDLSNTSPEQRVSMFELREVAGEVLASKTRLVFATEDPLADRLNLWGRRRMVQMSKRYPGMGIRFMMQRAEDGLRFWDL